MPSYESPFDIPGSAKVISTLKSIYGNNLDIDHILANNHSLPKAVVRNFPFDFINHSGACDALIWCHIHVAKTAGSAIHSYVETNRLHPVYLGLFSETITELVDQIEIMAGFSQSYCKCHSAFLSGHYTLDEFIRLLPQWPHDKRFVLSIRPLAEIAVSLFAFMVRTSLDPKLQLHARHWDYERALVDMEFEEWLKHPFTANQLAVYSSALGIDTSQHILQMPSGMITLLSRARIISMNDTNDWLCSGELNSNVCSTTFPEHVNSSGFDSSKTKYLEYASEVVDQMFPKELDIYNIMLAFADRQIHSFRRQ